MGREAVEREMKELAGTALSVLDRVPDELVDAEWLILRRSLFDDTLLPRRDKALIGVAVTAALRFPSGALFHSELARIHGASDAELAEVVGHSAFVSGWATRLSGLEFDNDRLATEITEVVRHVATRYGVEM